MFNGGGRSTPPRVLRGSPYPFTQFLYLKVMRLRLRLAPVRGRRQRRPSLVLFALQPSPPAPTQKRAPSSSSSTTTMSEAPLAGSQALSWVAGQANDMQVFWVQRHPFLSLAVFTSLILGASWYLKRIRKRLPAKDIDLYKYKSASSPPCPCPCPPSAPISSLSVFHLHFPQYIILLCSEFARSPHARPLSLSPPLALHFSSLPRFPSFLFFFFIHFALSTFLVFSLRKVPQS